MLSPQDSLILIMSILPIVNVKNHGRLMEQNPGSAFAPPGPASGEQEDDQSDRSKERREIALKVHRHCDSRFHVEALGSRTSADPEGLRNCAPRFALTGVRGSIGPASPKRFGSAGVGFAWNPCPRMSAYLGVLEHVSPTFPG